MNKERRRKEHDTTPCPYLPKAGRPSKKKGQSSSPQRKIDKNTHEYRAPQCADATEAPIPSYKQKRKKRNNHTTEIKLRDYKRKTLTHHLTTDHYFAYAQYLASELRKYDPQTLAHSKKEISEVLFNADKGTLLKQYHLCEDIPSNGNVQYKKIFPNHLPTDPYFAYCQYIASELRKYGHRTLACVKKAFSEILFKADTGTLSKSCHSRHSKHTWREKQENEQCDLPDTPPSTFLSNDEIDFQMRDEWKDLIPADGETSINPFQSTNEEIDSNWEDILSDDLPTNYEENNTREDLHDTINSSTEIIEHSSPEVMRFEGRNYSEEIISPVEYPRRTIDFLESELNFSPKLASTQVENGLESSRIFDSHVLHSTTMKISLGNKDVSGPDISKFLEDRNESDSLEEENSLPSTIEAPDIFNFEDVNGGKDTLVIETTPDGFEDVLNFFRKREENAETSFITTINTENIVDSVFKHPSEPSSLNLDEAVIPDDGTHEEHTQVTDKERSPNRTLINTPLSGKIMTRRFFLSDTHNFWFSKKRSSKANKSFSLRLLAKEGKKISPKQLFIHSKLSSGELNNSMIRQSSGKYKGTRKRKSARIFPPNPPKATNCSGTTRQDPFRLPSEEPEFDAIILESSHSSLLKSRKKTPRTKSNVIKEKETATRSPGVKWEPLSKKEKQRCLEYLKTLSVCPLSLQNSCCARINEDIGYGSKDKAQHFSQDEIKEQTNMKEDNMSDEI